MKLDVNINNSKSNLCMLVIQKEKWVTWNTMSTIQDLGKSFGTKTNRLIAATINQKIRLWVHRKWYKVIINLIQVQRKEKKDRPFNDQNSQDSAHSTARISTDIRPLQTTCPKSCCLTCKLLVLSPTTIKAPNRPDGYERFQPVWNVVCIEEVPTIPCCPCNDWHSNHPQSCCYLGSSRVSDNRCPENGKGYSMVDKQKEENKMNAGNSNQYLEKIPCWTITHNYRIYTCSLGVWKCLICIQMVKTQLSPGRQIWLWRQDTSETRRGNW